GFSDSKPCTWSLRGRVPVSLFTLRWLPQPGADDGVGEAHAIAEDSGLLGMTVQAALHSYGDLFSWNAALDRLDHELGGVELLLTEDQLREHGRADGPVAVGAVADLGAGDEGDEAVEEDDAELARDGVAVGLAEHPRAVGDVDLAVEDGLDQPLHLGGQVLAVGVEGDDDLGAR